MKTIKTINYDFFWEIRKLSDEENIHELNIIIDIVISKYSNMHEIVSIIYHLLERLHLKMSNSLEKLFTHKSNNINIKTFLFLYNKIHKLNHKSELL